MTFVPPAAGPTGVAAPTGVRVAFAVGRAAGGAVARNRLRRRLRAVVDDLARGGVGLPNGTYLVSARAEAQALTPFELRDAVATAVTAATAPTPSAPTHGAEQVGR